MKRAAVPVTGIKKNNYLSAWKNYVWFADHRRDVFVEAQARAPKSGTEFNLHL